MESSDTLLEIDKSTERSHKKLQRILKLSKSDFFTDCTVKVKTDAFPPLEAVIKANKTILASSSPYFLQKFQQNPELNSVEINGFKFSSVSKVIDYLYTDIITIDKYNLTDIVRLAKLLQLDQILESVLDYLRNYLKIENAIYIRDSLLSFGQMIEVETCDKFIKENFEDVSKTLNFKQVQFSYLLDLIDSSDIVVQDEKQIFNIVVEWVKFDISSRRENGFELFKSIRFPLIPEETLSEIQSNEFLQDTRLLQRMAETFYYLKKREFRQGQNALQPVDITPRKYKSSVMNLMHRNEAMDYLICFGGINESELMNSAVEISNNETNMWGIYHQMNQPRKFFTAVTWKDCVILVGGYATEINCTKYDLGDRTYTEMTKLPTSRREHGAAIIGSELYVSGGCFNPSSVISLDLDDSNGEWIAEEPMWHKRIGHAICSLKGLLFCCGGESLDSCESYNPKTKKWILLAAMKRIRKFSACCHDHDKLIYVAGGRDDRNKLFHSSVERYDINTNQWSTLQSSIGPSRWGCTMTMLKGNLILIGGQDRKGKVYDTVQKYSTETATWTEAGQLQCGRVEHQAVLNALDAQNISLSIYKMSGPYEDRLTHFRFPDNVLLLSSSTQEFKHTLEELSTASDKVALFSQLVFEVAQKSNTWYQEVNVQDTNKLIEELENPNYKPALAILLTTATLAMSAFRQVNQNIEILNKVSFMLFDSKHNTEDILAFKEISPVFRLFLIQEHLTLDTITTKVHETKHLFNVMGVYRDYTIGIVSLRYVAVWKSYLSIYVSFEWCCYNLTGHTVNIAYLKNEVPDTSLSKDDNGWKFGGLVGEPVSVVINHLGLKIGNLLPQSDDIYGDYNEETNVSTGMFTKLLTKEADMIIASLSLTSSRRKIADFSYPIMEQCISAIYKERTQNHSWKFFMKPLSKNSWMLTVTATCLFIIAAITFVNIFTLESTNLSTIWAMVMLQGIDVQSNSPGMLLLCFSFMLLGTLLSMFYSSTIISQNAVTSDKRPFNTLGEVAKSSEYKPLIWKGTSTLQLISNSKDDEYAAIWEKMKIDIDGHTVANVNESMQLLNIGQYVYIGRKGSLLHMQSVDHSMKLIDAEYDCSGIYIAFQKNSPLTGIFRKWYTD
ncbi:Kelch-like protein 20 [Nymphon striatum]|nr:Kelch-like protein 20 [Nymphon striatum]